MIKWIRGVLLGQAIILITIWIAFYELSLLPSVFTWWTIPAIMTIILFAYIPTMLGAALISHTNDIYRREE